MKHIVMSNSKSLIGNIVIDYTKSIMPVLWKFLDKHKRPCFISINIHMLNNELIISIINNKKIKRFIDSNNQNLVQKLCAYLKVS